MTTEGHTAFTGAPADVSPEEGGLCSWYGGFVHGRNVELVPGKRIVQVWRAKDWPTGLYSVIRYDLAASDDGTRVDFEQAGHPDDTADHLASGWHDRYWRPLTAYFEAA